MNLVILSIAFFTFWDMVDASRRPPKGTQIVTDTATGNSMRVSYVIMEEIPNKMIVGKPIGGMPAKNVLSCEGGCAKTVNCVSMNVRNYNGTFLKCDFYDFDHYEKKYLLVDANDVNYFVLKSGCVYNDTCIGQSYCSPNYTTGESEQCRCRNDPNNDKVCLKKNEDFQVMKNEQLQHIPFLPPNWQLTFNVTVQCDSSFNFPVFSLGGVDFTKDSAQLINNRLTRFYQKSGNFVIKRSLSDDVYNADFITPCQSNIPIQLTISNILEGTDATQTQFIWRRKVIINGVTSWEMEDTTHQLQYNDVYLLACGREPEPMVIFHSWNLQLFPTEYGSILGKPLQTMEVLTKSWFLQLDIKYETFQGNGATFIYREVGELDGVFLMSWPEQHQMKFTYDHSGISEAKTFIDLDNTQWYTITACQYYSFALEDFIFEVRIDGNLFWSVINTKPKEYENVELIVKGRKVRIKDYFLMNL
ncbi:uncharacterized protein [Clytia hemisphaerica]